MSHRIKNRNDPRYVNVQNRFEEALTEAFRRGYIARLQVGEVSYAAGVYPTTFSNHYPHMDAAFYQLGRKMEKSLKALEAEIRAANFSLEISYRKVLFFIYKNRDYYDAMLSRNYVTPLLLITDIFKPIFCKDWRNYSRELNVEVYQIFSWEFCGVIYHWRTIQNFDNQKIGYYARKLMKLAKSACDRLA